jgi:hypothetical protein
MIGGLHLGREQSQLYLPSRIPGERQLAQCSFFDFQAGRPPSPSPDGSQGPDRNRVCLAPDQVRAHVARPRPSSAQHREWIGLPGHVWPDHAGAAAIVAEAFCWCRVRAGRFFGGRDAANHDPRGTVSARLCSRSSNHKTPSLGFVKVPMNSVSVCSTQEPPLQFLIYAMALGLDAGKRLRCKAKLTKTLAALRNRESLGSVL